jgi:prepilin-type N-terminal cleavage/methylation domain-containing protein
MKASKGFTIIELVVVITITAVLVVIVSSNVTSQRNKGKDAAAKSNLNSLVIAGVRYFESSGNYNDFFNNTNADWVKISNALLVSNMNYTIAKTCDGTGDCNGGSNAIKWCAMITLKVSGNTYCVDSAGKKIDKSSGTCVGGVCN